MINLQLHLFININSLHLQHNKYIYYMNVYVCVFEDDGWVGKTHQSSQWQTQQELSLYE